MITVLRIVREGVSCPEEKQKNLALYNINAGNKLFFLVLIAPSLKILIIRKIKLTILN